MHPKTHTKHRTPNATTKTKTTHSPTKRTTAGKNHKKEQKKETKSYKQGEDYVIYADDTNFLLQEEKPENTTTRLQHYSTLTKTRRVKIQWGKVKLLTRKKKTQTPTMLPHPYNQIQTATTGTVLGGKLTCANTRNHPHSTDSQRPK